MTPAPPQEGPGGANEANLGGGAEGKYPDSGTDRQTGRQADRQADRQTGRQADRQTQVSIERLRLFHGLIPRDTLA